MNIKSIRIELQQLALELEKEEPATIYTKDNGKYHVADPVINKLENLVRDLKIVTGRKP
jgi:hypothetical protein